MIKTSFFRSLFEGHRRAVTAGLAVLLLCGYLRAQTPVILSPVPKLQFFDANGKPLAFGCVFSYQTLSTTPLATYTDYTGSVANTNPLILNSGGFVGTGGLWLQAGQAYRLVVKSAGGSACSLGSTISTVDGISGGATTLTTIVPYSSTPTFAAAAQNQLFEITLTGNATSQPLTAVGITPPGIFTWEITQDVAGGHAFTWPANVIGGVTISSSSNTTTQQSFIWNGTNAIALGSATYGPSVNAFGVTDLYDFGLSASSTLCTDANKRLTSSCGSVLGITVNGQAISPGGSGNVNSGAAGHSLALNEGAGVPLTGLSLGANQLPVGQFSADPVATTVPDCQDSAGKHLNFTQSGNSFTCGSSNSFGSAIRTFSVTGCTPASSTDSQCTGTITVSPAFADANYIVTMTANNNGTAQNAVLPVTVNGSLSSSSIPYVLSCTFFCSPVNTPTIYVIAIHP